MTTTSDPGQETVRRRTRHSRGQVVVIFAGAMLLFAMLSAAVIDLSWYWTNNLRMQRAADAAALAGAVWLPGNPAKAILIARQEAVKNGFSDGVAGFSVTPVPQPYPNDRRLKVTITGPIGTYFARIVGITSFMASRNSLADFVLPVPMGSPQQWYGVGNYEVFSPGVPHTTGPKLPTGNSGGGWTNPNRAYTFDAPGGAAYATNGTGNSQVFTTFGINVPGGDTINGIGLRARAKSTDATGCRLAVALSWNNGANWTAERFATLGNTDVASPYFAVSDATQLWGRAWTTAELANLQVKVRDDDPDPGSGAICTDAATTSLDAFDVTVFSTSALVAPTGATALPTPPGESVAPTSQGFWGAIFTKGGVRRNGDRYAPTSYDPGVPNTEYDGLGYDYTIEFKPGASNGRVFLFDAPFCAVGANSSGSWYGAGDHWTTQASSNSTPDPGGPVTTVYTLYWDKFATPYFPGDDVVVATDSETAQKQIDQSGNVGAPNTGGGATDCSSNPRHNAWYQMPTGPLVAGRYRLNVNTSQAGNANTGAENLWSIYVGADGGAGLARVYGDGRMVGYNNITSTTGYQKFYLAQIDKIHAGKTMVIELFDPGDVGSNSWIRVLSPNGNTYGYATFSYAADGACVSGNSDTCTGTNRQAIQTYRSGGGSSFDNSVVTISIPLPANYGAGGLTPAGETEPGWWKIEYQVGMANDTTTWRVTLRGNPVHLVLP
jgi:hypothetical protein